MGGGVGSGGVGEGTDRKVPQVQIAQSKYCCASHVSAYLHSRQARLVCEGFSAPHTFTSLSPHRLPSSLSPWQGPARVRCPGSVRPLSRARDQDQASSAGAAMPLRVG